MHICTKCGLDKEDHEFAWKNKAAGRRSPMCKACHSAYSKQHYKDNKQNYLSNTARSRPVITARNKAWVLEYLKSHSCVDCGEPDIEVLEFDHIEMIGALGKRISAFMNGSLSVLQAEVAKCEVRCANCHTRRTRRQLGWERL